MRVRPLYAVSQTHYDKPVSNTHDRHFHCEIVRLHGYNSLYYINLAAPMEYILKLKITGTYQDTIHKYIVRKIKQLEKKYNQISLVAVYLHGERVQPTPYL